MTEVAHIRIDIYGWDCLCGRDRPPAYSVSWYYQRSGDLQPEMCKDCLELYPIALLNMKETYDND